MRAVVSTVAQEAWGGSVSALRHVRSIREPRRAGQEGLPGSGHRHLLRDHWGISVGMERGQWARGRWMRALGQAGKGGVLRCPQLGDILASAHTGDEHTG